MDWIDLAQDRDKWPVLLNTVRNLRFSKKWRYSQITVELSASQDVLCPMYLGAFRCYLTGRLLETSSTSMVRPTG
jgi:hypothetical protein